MQQRKGTQTRSNGQRAADDHWKTCNRQHATCNMHRGKCNRRHAICNMENATDNTQRASDNFRTTCAMQRAICSGQQRHATQHAACSMQQATWNQEKTIDNRQQGNQATRQHAACSRHRAEDGKTMQRMQQTTCNTQQTTCKRTRAHASCNKETHGTTDFRARRAACSGQAAACEKHCTRQPVRNTAQTPHTRCNIRPVPQQAASTRGTGTTQQALKRTR
jgi:hypothetical protein